MIAPAHARAWCGLNAVAMIDAGACAAARWRVFVSKQASNLVLKAAEIVDTRNANGVMASDHKPMLVRFEVK